jgi:PAS domain S-box-containing protein
LVLNFLTGQNINYREITQLQHIRFLGETVSTPAGTVNPWMLVAQLSLWLLIFFTLDAAISVWRKGDRRQALWVGGGILFFELAGTVQAVLVVGQITPVPFMVSFFYMGIVMVMGYELSRDVLCAVQLGHDLRESEKRLSMAADAAKLGIWVRELTKNEIWATENWRQLFGFTKTEPLTLDLFLQRLHPDDRDGVHQALTQLNNNNPHYEKEYRILPLAGQIRWIASRGRAEFDGAGKPVLVRGVSVDITHRKQAELEAQSRREELAHLSRVTMLGELSGSLAHELNQPLTAILSNAQAAQRFLSRDDADLNEVREILADIVSEDKRAGEVISRLRVLLKKGEAQHQSLDLNEVVQEALKLVRNDLFNHAVSAHLELARDLPAVKADRVQLQQVLLNTVTNACHAMANNSPKDRVILIRTVATSDEGVRVEIEDRGCGIPAENLERVFQSFFTTRIEGMGMGLAICHNIIKAHAGKMWAKNNPERGATFYFTLPAYPGGKA